MAVMPAPPTVNGDDWDADKHGHRRGDDSDTGRDENDNDGDGDGDDGGNDNDDDDDDNGNDNDDDRKDIIATDSRPDDYSDPVVVAVTDSSILLLHTRLIFLPVQWHWSFGTAAVDPARSGCRPVVLVG